MTVKYGYTFDNGEQEAKTIENVNTVSENGSFVKVVFVENNAMSTKFFEKRKFNYFDVKF